MSFDDVKAVLLGRGIPHLQKCVLIALAHHTSQGDPNHEAYPSHQTIAEMMDLSVRSVARGLKWLEEVRIIRAVPTTKGGGRHITVHYLLNMEEVSAWHDYYMEELRAKNHVTLTEFGDGYFIVERQNHDTQSQNRVPVADDQGMDPVSETNQTKKAPLTASPQVSASHTETSEDEDAGEDDDQSLDLTEELDDGDAEEPNDPPNDAAPPNEPRPLYALPAPEPRSTDQLLSDFSEEEREILMRQQQRNKERKLAGQ